MKGNKNLAYEKVFYATALTMIALAAYVVFSLFFFNMLLDKTDLKKPVRTSPDIVWGEE